MDVDRDEDGVTMVVIVGVTGRSEEDGVTMVVMVGVTGRSEVVGALARGVLVG